MKPPTPAQSTISPRYFRRADAARYLSISPRLLAEWQRRRVVAFRKIGRACLFRADDLDSAVDRFRQAAIGELPKPLTAITAPITPRKRRAGRITPESPPAA